ncbi:MAG: DUF1573 domain-containing protein [Planctomycetota bacterium]
MSYSAVRLSLAALLAALTISPAAAQEWARKMFSETRHDFGTIARSAKAEYEFEFQNIFLEDVHIASVRSSCGCTSPLIKESKSLLKTYEKGAIVAKINSASFLGQRSATVTVSIDRPYRAEVQLQVSVYIRDDIVLNPGSVQFGSIEQGQAAERQVEISTPGRRDLKILEVRSPLPSITAQLVPRAGSWGTTGYALKVQLAGNVPPGYLDGHLVLVTSGRYNTQVPVPIEGVVRPALSVSPSWLLLGVVSGGQTVTKQVVLRGRTPFVVTQVLTGQAFDVDISSASTPKNLHVLPVKFTASQSPGTVRETVRLQTSLGGAIAEFTAEAMVTTPRTEIMAAKPTDTAQNP